MVELDLDLEVWGSLFNTCWGRSKNLNQNELWESINYLTSGLWKAITHQPTIHSFVAPLYTYWKLYFFVQRKTLKQMHWKRADVFTEQIFHALFSTTYAFVFMEVRSIKQAMDRKGPNYPYKSNLFKH